MPNKGTPLTNLHDLATGLGFVCIYDVVALHDVLVAIGGVAEVCPGAGGIAGVAADVIR